MNSWKRTLSHSLCISLLLPAIAASQVIVVEAGEGVTPGSQQQQRAVTVQPAPAPSRSNPPPSDSNEVVISLYLQLEALQQEVQALRGLVEEQNYQMRRMQTEQRDRYLDVDSRLTELQSQIDINGVAGANAGVAGASAPVLSPAQESAAGAAQAVETQSPVVNRPAPIQVNPQESNPGIMQPAIVSAPVSAGANPPDQRELYRQALSQLLDESNYDQAIILFSQYLENFPNGRYVTNAYYWQGEALILAERYNEAIEAFQHIINRFPDDPKAPGAMLKSGVAYNQMGDIARAMDYWQTISEKYPDSVTEIRAAQDYIQRAQQ